MKRANSMFDDLAKSRFAPFCSTGEDFSSPAIRNEFGHFHPHLRPAHKAPRPVDGLFAGPSCLTLLLYNVMKNKRNVIVYMASDSFLPSIWSISRRSAYPASGILHTLKRLSHVGLESLL